ncbi:MAG TPA: histidine kinase [Dehalococcoidia bacterium]|nr:histidine kinase [Dehalococcoidia bacterium]
MQSVVAHLRQHLQPAARRLLPLFWLAWLPFGVPATVQLFRSNSGPVRLGVSLAGVALFVAVYVWAAFANPMSRRFTTPDLGAEETPPWWPIAVLAALSVAFNAAYGSGWLGLYIYTAASVGPRCSPGRGAWIVLGLTTLTALTGLGQGVGAGATAQACLLVGGIGLSVVLMSQAVRTVRDLRAARAEVARLAVAEERLRFARDLHDLLGHSLSLIALKCDLAKQLVPVAPERAASEIEDAEKVARAALHEVREAVAGYRQTSLASEVAGAREVLAAAGIALHYDGALTALPPAVEDVLAWTVREGITNVIRHSRARRCRIAVWRDGDQARIQITDDGIGGRQAGAAPAAGGHGLAGLAERARALGGGCEAGARPEGGFHLMVWLPLTAGAEPARDERVAAGVARAPA